MTVVGPKDPMNPIGPPVPVATYGAAGCEYREFFDGYVYLFHWKLGEDWIFPRGKLLKVITNGPCMGSFPDGDVNYLAFWFSRERHERVFPGGPPGHRDHSGADIEEARAHALRVLDPWSSNPGASAGDTQDIKIAKIARLAQERGIV